MLLLLPNNIIIYTIKYSTHTTEYRAIGYIDRIISGNLMKFTLVNRM